VRLSVAKQAAILATVKLNPEVIGSDDDAFLSEVIRRCGVWLAQICGFKQYPEAVGGIVIGGAAPLTDLSAIDSGIVYVRVGESPYMLATVDTAEMQTGADAATELQRAIRAVDYPGFGDVVVTFATGIYTVSSSRIGPGSNISFDAGINTQVASAMRLTKEYGATVEPGALPLPEFDAMVAHLVTAEYRTVGLEGLQSGSVPGGISFARWETLPDLQRFIGQHRKLP
jgi:hypothetical protein